MVSVFFKYSHNWYSLVGEIRNTNGDQVRSENKWYENSEDGEHVGIAPYSFLMLGWGRVSMSLWHGSGLD